MASPETVAVLDRLEAVVARLEARAAVRSRASTALDRLEAVVRRLEDRSVAGGRHSATVAAPSRADQEAPPTATPVWKTVLAAFAARGKVAGTGAAKDLNLNFAQMDGDDAAALLASLDGHEEIVDLSLAGCGLGDDVLVPLLELLGDGERAPPRLARLNIETNDLRDDGWAALVAVIEASASLREIKATNQRTPPSDAVQMALAEAVETSGRLTRLALDFTSTSARNRFDRAVSANAFAAYKAREATDAATGKKKTAPRRRRVAVSSTLSLSERVEAAAQAYAEWNVGRAASYILFGLGSGDGDGSEEDDGRVRVIAVGPDGADHSAFVAALTGLGPARPAWAVTHFGYQSAGAGHDRSKTVFVAWVPDSVGRRDRMRFAELTSALKAACAGVQASIHAEDADDLAFEAVRAVAGRFDVD